jgi:tRNA (guanine-N7-)-methyltransferase|tara:strand:+ start:1079 stop:1759 length:681 start_codon:yes stop_codon:yes gene_type:complete
VKLSSKPKFFRTIKSFVRRSGRITAAQKNAWEKHWVAYGIESRTNTLDLSALFKNKNQRFILEIGYGNGENLIDCAKNDPHSNFAGIEVYPSGIGQCLINANKYGLKNLRLICDDAVDVLNKQIVDKSFDVINIFFPDPWPKKRHHKRRLITEDFISLVESKLKPNGHIHICTDWDDYAYDIQAIFNAMEGFKPLEKLPRRLQTKFEKKGLALGHSIHEFAFQLLH